MSTFAIVCLSLWVLRSLVAARLEPTSMDELGESIKRRHPVVLVLNLATSGAFLALAIWAVGS